MSMDRATMQKVMAMPLIKRSCLVDGEGRLYWEEWRRDRASGIAVKISFQGSLTVPKDTPM